VHIVGSYCTVQYIFIYTQIRPQDSRRLSLNFRHNKLIKSLSS